MSIRPSTYIIVPAFNEGPVLEGVLDGLLEQCRDAEVVVVDDGSHDRTAEIASSRSVHLLRHITNLGQGAALTTGMNYAVARGAEILVTFDADGQHDPADVDRIVEPVAQGDYDVAFGTRFSDVKPEGVGLTRWLTLRVGIWFTRALLRLPVRDTNNGLRAISAYAATQMKLEQNRMSHALEIIYETKRLKLRWTEVPVRIRYTSHSRAKGQSSLGGLDILADLWAARR